MSLSIKFQKVFGVPVAPDAISGGTVSIASYPAITGDFITNVNVNLKTYTFDLRGINTELADSIILICDTNAESLAKGEIDLSNPTGTGSFLYRGITCLPISYQDGGTINVANTTNNFNSFQVTALTDVITASV